MHRNKQPIIRMSWSARNPSSSNSSRLVASSGTICPGLGEAIYEASSHWVERLRRSFMILCGTSLRTARAVRWRILQAKARARGLEADRRDVAAAHESVSTQPRTGRTAIGAS